MKLFAYEKKESEELAKAKIRKFSRLQGEVKNALGRIQHSAKAGTLQEEADRLNDLVKLCQTANSFQSLVVAAAPEPETFFELKKELHDAGFSIGPHYDAFELRLHGRQSMMRGDVAALLLLCSASAPIIQRLQATIDHSNIVDAVDGIVLDAMLEPAGKLTSSDVQKTPTQCSYKQTLKQICDKMLEVQRSPAFLVSTRLREDVRLFGTIVDPWPVPVQTLSTDVETLEASRVQNADDTSPLVKFLLEGTVDLKMLAAAKDGRAEEQDVSVCSCQPQGSQSV